MDKNTNKNLTDMLSKLDPKTIKQGISSLSSLLGSKDGEKLKKQLGNIDKDKLMETFNQLDTDTIKEKLAGIDLGKVDLGQIANNPDVAQKLKEVMENNQKK